MVPKRNVCSVALLQFAYLVIGKYTATFTTYILQYNVGADARIQLVCHTRL